VGEAAVAAVEGEGKVEAEVEETVEAGCVDESEPAPCAGAVGSSWETNAPIASGAFGSFSARSA